jgi:hypothetical protein
LENVWRKAADFDPLFFFLQHTPYLERLFLQIKLVCVVRDLVNIASSNTGFGAKCIIPGRRP